MSEYFTDIVKVAGMAAGIIMPLFNFPLVYKIWKRKSSSDISLVWALGIWGSILLMLPASLISPDPVFNVFGILNFILFTGVVISVLKFR
ncbi:MAG TPA: hypothetical protein PKG60_15065 [Spirochaetota bacterium]|nr:hypothetical protein [Spirochaetota bacterium]HPS87102.1 hypothetical protein [Spirochaetota bacterium]